MFVRRVLICLFIWSLFIPGQAAKPKKDSTGSSAKEEKESPPAAKVGKESPPAAKVGKESPPAAKVGKESAPPANEEKESSPTAKGKKETSKSAEEPSLPANEPSPDDPSGIERDVDDPRDKVFHDKSELKATHPTCHIGAGKCRRKRELGGIKTAQTEEGNGFLKVYETHGSEKLITSIIYFLENNKCSKASKLVDLLYKKVVQKVNNNKTKNKKFADPILTKQNRYRKRRSTILQLENENFNHFQANQIHQRRMKRFTNMFSLSEKSVYLTTPLRLQHIISEIYYTKPMPVTHIDEQIKRERNYTNHLKDEFFRKHMLVILNDLEKKTLRDTGKAIKEIESLFSHYSDLRTTWFLSKFIEYVKGYKKKNMGPFYDKLASMDYEQIESIKEENLHHKQELLDILKVIDHETKAHAMITDLFKLLALHSTINDSHKDTLHTDSFLAENIEQLINIINLLKNNECNKATVQMKILYTKLKDSKGRINNMPTSPKQNLIKGHNVPGDNYQTYNKEKTLYSLIYLEDMVDRLERGRSISSSSHHLEEFLKKHHTFRNHGAIRGILHLLKERLVTKALGLIKLLRQKTLPSVENLRPKINRRRRSTVPQSDTVSILRRILLLKSFGVERLNRLADKLTKSELRITKLHPDPKYRYVVFKILKNIVNEEDKKASYLLDDFSNWLNPKGMKITKHSKSRTNNHSFNKQRNGTNEKQPLSSSNHNNNNLELNRTFPSNITLTFKQNININLFGEKDKSTKNIGGSNTKKLTNRHDNKPSQGRQILPNKNEIIDSNEVKQWQDNWRYLTNSYRKLTDMEEKENEKGSQNRKIPKRLQPTKNTKEISREIYVNTNQLLNKKKKMSATTTQIDIDQTISKLTPITLMHESKHYENAKVAIEAERQRVKSLQKDLQRKISAILQAVEEKSYFKAKHLILQLEVERELQTLENFYSRKGKETSNLKPTRKSILSTKNNEKIENIEKDTERHNKKSPRKLNSNRLVEEKDKISVIENETESQNKKAPRKLNSNKQAEEKQTISEIENETGSQNKKAPRKLNSNKLAEEKNIIAEIENETKTGSQNKKAPKISKSTEMTSRVGNVPTKNKKSPKISKSFKMTSRVGNVPTKNNKAPKISKSIEMTSRVGNIPTTKKHLKGKPNMQISWKSKLTVGKEKRKQNNPRTEEKNPLEMMVSRLSSIITLKENKQTKRANELIKTVRGKMQTFSKVVRRKIDSILKYILEGEYIQAKLLVIELEHPEESPTDNRNDRETEHGLTNRRQGDGHNLQGNQKSKSIIEHNITYKDERSQSKEPRKMRKNYRRIKRSMNWSQKATTALHNKMPNQNDPHERQNKHMSTGTIQKKINDHRVPHDWQNKHMSTGTIQKKINDHRVPHNWQNKHMSTGTIQKKINDHRVPHNWQNKHMSTGTIQKKINDHRVPHDWQNKHMSTGTIQKKTNDHRVPHDWNTRNMPTKKIQKKINDHTVPHNGNTRNMPTKKIQKKINDHTVPHDGNTRNMPTENNQNRVNDDFLTRYDKTDYGKLIESIIYLFEKNKCSHATALTSLLYRNIVKKVNQNRTKNSNLPIQGAGSSTHHTSLTQRITYLNTPSRLKHIIQELRAKRSFLNATRLITHERLMFESSGDARFQKEMKNILDHLQNNKTTQAEQLIESLVAKDSDLWTAWFLARFKDYVNYKMWHFWNCVREMVSRDYDKILNITAKNLKNKKELIDILTIIFSNRNKAIDMTTALFEKLLNTVPENSHKHIINKSSINKTENKIHDTVTDSFLTHNIKMVEHIMLLLKNKQCSRAAVATKILYTKLEGAKSRIKNKSLHNLVNGPINEKDRMYTMYSLVLLEDMIGRLDRDKSISATSHHLENFQKKHPKFKNHKSISVILDLLKKKKITEAMSVIKLLKLKTLPSFEKKEDHNKNRRRRSIVRRKSDTVSRLRRILQLKSRGDKFHNRVADKLTMSEVKIAKHHPDPEYRFVVFKILKNIVNDEVKKASYLLDNFPNRFKQQGMKSGKLMKGRVYSKSRTANHTLNTKHNGTMKIEKLSNSSAIPHKSIASSHHSKNDSQHKTFARPKKLGSIYHRKHDSPYKLEASSNHNRNNLELYQKLPGNITLIVRPKFNIFLSGKKLSPLKNSTGNYKLELTNRHDRRLLQGKQSVQHKQEKTPIDEVKQSKENRKYETNRHRALIDKEKHIRNTKIEHAIGSRKKNVSTKDVLTKDGKRKQTKDNQNLSKSGSQEHRKNVTNRYRALIAREKHNKDLKIENETGSRNKKASTETKEGTGKHTKDNKHLSKSRSEKNMTNPKIKQSSSTQNLQKSQIKERIDPIDRTISELTSITSMQESKSYENAKTAINAERKKVKTYPKDLQGKIGAVFQAIEEKNFFRARHLILKLQVEREFATLDNISIHGKKTASRKQMKGQNKKAKMENETGVQSKKAPRRLISTKETEEKNKNAKLKTEIGSLNRKASKTVKSNKVTKEQNKIPGIKNEKGSDKKAPRKLKSTTTSKDKNKTKTLKNETRSQNKKISKSLKSTGATEHKTKILEREKRPRGQHKKASKRLKSNNVLKEKNNQSKLKNVAKNKNKKASKRLVKMAKNKNKKAKIENETGSQNKKSSKSTEATKHKNKVSELKKETGGQHAKDSKKSKLKVPKEKIKKSKLEKKTEIQNKKAPKISKSIALASRKENSPKNNKHLKRKPKMRRILKEKNTQTNGKEKRPVGLNSHERIASSLASIIALEENLQTKKANALIKKVKRRLRPLSKVLRKKVDSILNYIMKEEYIKAKLLIIELEQSELEVSPTAIGKDRNTEDVSQLTSNKSENFAWGPWSACSTTCGVGRSERRQQCIKEDECYELTHEERRPCWLAPCPDE
ncbi:uncharacterized protein PF3D7_1120600-like isoform X1 [Mytilus edulis]|uniref:uncharacterized protein PF3D7_1120600-like isoform X1 n=1 Tax=Mytilus edulis TaxID=6550 RepID=UPI0039EDF696